MEVKDNNTGDLNKIIKKHINKAKNIEEESVIFNNIDLEPVYSDMSGSKLYTF
jgi:hypothetical protein